MNFGQVHSLWEVLSQESISIFVRTPLPGTLRITEVNFDVSVQAEAFMIGELLTTIPSERLVQFSRQLVGLPNECVDYCLCIFARHPDQHDKPCMAFHQGRYLAVVAAAQQVTFPVTRYGSVFGFSRSLSDRDRISNPAVVAPLLCVMS